MASRVPWCTVKEAMEATASADTASEVHRCSERDDIEGKPARRQERSIKTWRRLRPARIMSHGGSAVQGVRRSQQYAVAVAG